MFLVSLKEMHIDLFISNNLSNYAFMKYIEIEIFLLRLINFKTQWLYPLSNDVIYPMFSPSYIYLNKRWNISRLECNPYVNFNDVHLLILLTNQETLD